ncbi:conserved hypothetical protein [Theileria equi strain WA]|uniref:Splicing factor YJU2 n=1 Tax=Theileria equi strain WA TaxID=1537102 RepID=L1LBM9_THEEQ|nr:conserved hypothetical protein [Theileria equi strain WA]EKX72583.1 conserved hypothetical protein [Theileria equi strain WA]|eukprot:XP_004832035.1 conserved hypothetical protein [Theileria equi strain WA]
MSTLKAARADNFYYPPDADESYRTQRKRMRKTPKKVRAHGISLKYGRIGEEGDDIWNQGPKGPVIRFEMPFKVICLGCGAFIAKGVRFDAERKRVGKYYSTNIYAFRMSCLYCHTQIVIQTDPENTDYLCKEGVRKRIEENDPSKALGYDAAEKQMRASNALFVLEQQAEEELKKGALAVPSEGAQMPRLEPEKVEKAEVVDENRRLGYLERMNEGRNKDDYLANSALRRRFRNEKKELEKRRDDDGNSNFSLPLLDVSKEDLESSKKTTFVSESGKIRAHFKRLVKARGDVFSKGSVHSSSTISMPNSLKEKHNRLKLVKFIESRAHKR